MSDTATPTPGGTSGDERQLVIITYALMLLGFVTGGVSSIIAVVIAHLKKDGLDGLWQSHMDFIIRTFWISLGISILCFALMFIFIGLPMFLLLSIWIIIRMVAGVLKANDRKPIADPRTMTF